MLIYVAGINGMVGSAVAEEFLGTGYHVAGKPSSEVDFLDRVSTFRHLKEVQPEGLIIAAAKVGGIGANLAYPVEFLTQNLQIQCNLIDAAHAEGVRKVLFLGSSCIYPKFAPQPIVEEALLTGELEPTNEPYALAKIAGIKLINAYRNEYGHHWVSAMPTNLYGPHDNFDLENSHVLPALIAKFHQAKILRKECVTLWGDGSPLRDFLHVRDLAAAVRFLLENYDDTIPINVGSGSEISIMKLAVIVSEVVGYNGKIDFDSSRPNGTPRKILDVNRITELGWRPNIDLQSGVQSTYDWYRRHVEEEIKS